MGPIKLDPKIMKTMKSWGDNYNSLEGCGHDSDDDKLDSEINSKDITLNIPSKMDAVHPKTNNPGVDMGFWAKAKPLSDTTGHGTLTRKLKD